MSDKPRFASILVGLDGGPGAASRVGLAARIAQRFDARLTGVAGQGIPISLYAGGWDGGYTEIAAAERSAIRRNLAAARQTFQGAAPSSATWLEGERDPTDLMVHHASLADLIVLARRGSDDAYAGPLSIDPGSVALRAGRPLLMVPPNDERDSASNVLVAWNDSRESRRALSDALPFLAGAQHVFVLGIGQGAVGESLSQACTYLSRRGIEAHARHVPEGDVSIAQEIFARLETMEINLLVAGAFGHSRLREWVFGGVTWSLLEKTPCPCLLSH